MNISDRIEKIKDYFLKFNVDQGIITLALKFPEKWTVPDSEFLKKQFGVASGPLQNGVIYCCEITEGFDKIFDAADYTISFNKEAQERMALFNAKAKELKELFMTESLDSLKTLNFVFDKKKKRNVSVKSKSIIEKVTETVENKSSKEAIVPKEEVETEDSLLSAAKEVITEATKIAE